MIATLFHYWRELVHALPYNDINDSSSLGGGGVAKMLVRIEP
jgi:hypothetical protein